MDRRLQHSRLWNYHVYFAHSKRVFAALIDALLGLYDRSHALSDSVRNHGRRSPAARECDRTNYPRMDQLNLLDNDISDEVKDGIVKNLQSIVARLDICFVCF